MTHTKSQTQRIKTYLLSGKKLTALSALKLFGCFRLASRVNEIKSEYKVTVEMIRVRGKRIARYSIGI
jgi:hypothetical protein